LYLDEDIHLGIAVALRRRGFDVVATPEAERRGTTDEEQLAFATAAGRCLVTFNRGDFVRLHERYVAEGREHAGIILARQAAIGPMVRALAGFLATATAAELAERLFWLKVD
jgi:hypothetical protein